MVRKLTGDGSESPRYTIHGMSTTEHTTKTGPAQRATPTESNSSAFSGSRGNSAIRKR